MTIRRNGEPVNKDYQVNDSKKIEGLTSTEFRRKYTDAARIERNLDESNHSENELVHKIQGFQKKFENLSKRNSQLENENLKLSKSNSDIYQKLEYLTNENTKYFTQQEQLHRDRSILEEEQKELSETAQRLISNNSSLEEKNLALNEHIQKLTKDNQDAINLQKQLLAEKAQVQLDIFKLESEKSDLENSSGIADSAKGFMKEETSIRKERRNSFQNISHLWSLFTAVLIAIGLKLFYDQYDGFDLSLILKNGIPVSTATFLLLKGGFFITAFAVAIKFSMTFRDKYAKESSNEDLQLQSMAYGKFYIDTYAATSTRKQVTDALSNLKKTTDSNDKLDTRNEHEEEGNAEKENYLHDLPINTKSSLKIADLYKSFLTQKSNKNEDENSTTKSEEEPTEKSKTDKIQESS